jgi:hypothetical protein
MRGISFDGPGSLLRIETMAVSVHVTVAVLEIASNVVQRDSFNTLWNEFLSRGECAISALTETSGTVRTKEEQETRERTYDA